MIRAARRRVAEVARRPNIPAVDIHADSAYTICAHAGHAMPQPDNDKQAPQPRRIGVREFRGNLSGLLRQARQGGSFLIMSHGQVLAEVRPPSPADRPRRRPGSLRGRIRMAPDFDVLPPDVLAAMEGAKA